MNGCLHSKPCCLSGEHGFQVGMEEGLGSDPVVSGAEELFYIVSSIGVPAMIFIRDSPVPFVSVLAHRSPSR